MRIDTDQYFGLKEHTEDQWATAVYMLEKVNALLTHLKWEYPLDPDTGTGISGSRNGSGDGGFRLPTAITGSKTSAHKLARAVDIYDPKDVLDESLNDNLLRQFGLYREHPGSTRGWVHLQDIPPGSGRRTFIP